MRKLLFALKDGSRTPSELRTAIGVQHRQTFRENYLNPAIRAGLICAEDGLSPHDPRIRYALTDRGTSAINEVTENTGEIAESDRVADRVSDGVAKAIFEMIALHPGVRTNEIATSIGKSIPTVSRYVKALKDNRKIEFRGAPKNGGYYITGNGG